MRQPRRTLRRLNYGRSPDRRIEAARLARALTNRPAQVGPKNQNTQIGR
nr:MAG TPA: hypothetical protein [Caudoviricetes sp.]